MPRNIEEEKKRKNKKEKVENLERLLDLYPVLAERPYLKALYLRLRIL